MDNKIKRHMRIVKYICGDVGSGDPNWMKRNTEIIKIGLLLIGNRGRSVYVCDLTWWD